MKEKKTVDAQLIEAAEKCDLVRVRKLISTGANVHALDDYSLRMAAYCGHVECVRELIKAGANVHALDDAALRWTMYRGYSKYIECVRELIKAGADVHACADDALLAAVRARHAECVQELCMGRVFNANNVIRIIDNLMKGKKTFDALLTLLTHVRFSSHRVEEKKEGSGLHEESQ